MLEILKRGAPVSRSQLIGLLSVQTVVFLSQALLNKSALVDVPAPLLLLLLESFMTVIFIIGGWALGYYELRTLKNHTRTIGDLQGLILAKLASGVTRTYCMEAVDGSVFNLVRGLVLPFAVGLSYVFVAPPTKTSLLPVAVVCLGFYFGTVSDQSDIKSIGGSYGLTIGILSSFFAALDLTVTKMTLDSYSTYDILYVTNLSTVVATLPMIYFGSEYTDHLLFSSMTLVEHLDMRSFFYKAFVCGILTFVSAVLALVQLDLTSPTTHQITTSARGVLQSILSVYYLGETIRAPQVISILVILGGSVGYTYIKELEHRETGYALHRSSSGGSGSSTADNGGGKHKTGPMSRRGNNDITKLPMEKNGGDSPV